jgi:hypothetical protein
MSSFLIRNLCNTNFNFIFLVSVNVKCVIGTAHMEDKDTNAHVHRNKKRIIQNLT